MADSNHVVRLATIASCAVAFLFAACSSDTLVPTAAPSASASHDAGGFPNGGFGNGNGNGNNGNNGNHYGFSHSRVCAAADAGAAACHAWVAVDDQGQPFAASGPSGYNPSDLTSAYGLSTAGGSGQTVAIVDAYDDPNAESDLAVYRQQFGLPACTTANGCFKKVNQLGKTTGLPRADAGWAEEISLDLDMVSAICPNCHILLVEASSTSFASLGASVDMAASLGAKVISNSYGGSEYSTEVTDQSHFNHPGVMITVSSGDAGYGVEFPASSQYVTAVGGTTLTKNGSTFTETVWSGAGSGCSKYIPKQPWQTDACAKRTVADVAAVADPNTGVSVYDTYGLNRRNAGWLVFGGTSVASPLIGAVYALAGNEGSLNYGSYSYSHTSSLFDVVSGNNGSCGGSYLCTAGPHYDGPTGNGTPRGLGAF
jgi:subtilase family serine protease